ncbi:MAG TPA: hypothetical protein VFU68_00135 [Terracidiphilus sp.]|nr:hypothetical protein [Terracidiphilus sp.]
MKAIVLFAAVAACAAAQTHVEAPMHTETTFQLNVATSYAKAFALFGPEGERAWAGVHWDPHVVWPKPPRDAAGIVFTVAKGPLTSVWVNTEWDQKAGRLKYVYVIPAVMTTTIELRLRDEGAQTHVTVTYARTALSEQGRAHVEAMTKDDQRAGVEWQASLDALLQQKK